MKLFKFKTFYFFILLFFFISCEYNNHVRTYTLSKQNIDKSNSLKTSQSNNNGLTWVKPNSWIISQGSSMRLASFSVPHKGGLGDLSVIQLMSDGGGLELNVNRWRRQLQLDPVSIQEIDNSIIMYNGNIGNYSIIRIINEKTHDAFICAILPINNKTKTLFIKLSIKSDYILEVEKDFIEFCSSIDISI